MTYREFPVVCSSSISCCAGPTPAFSHHLGIELLGGIECCDALTIQLDLVATVNPRQARLDVPANRCPDALRVVIEELIGNTHADALLPAIDRPDQGAVGGVEFFNSGLLFD